MMIVDGIGRRRLEEMSGHCGRGNRNQERRPADASAVWVMLKRGMGGPAAFTLWGSSGFFFHLKPKRNQ